MLVRTVLLEYPAERVPPEQLVITFPSLKKRRRASDEFETLKDRLPLTYKLTGAAAGCALPMDTSVAKRAPIAAEAPIAEAEAEGRVPASAQSARHLLHDPAAHAGSLDEQLERKLLRAAADDHFDQVVLPLISLQLQVRGLQHDRLVLFTMEPTLALDEEEEQQQQPRRKRLLPAAQEKTRGVAFRGPVKTWEFSLVTPLEPQIDNAWFRKVRSAAAEELVSAQPAVVVDAPCVGWWEVLADTTLNLPAGKRNVHIAAAGGIAPHREDGSYYDQYKDLVNAEYSDADSVDYGESDSERGVFNEAWFDDSDAADSRRSLSSDPEAEFGEYL